MKATVISGALIGLVMFLALLLWDAVVSQSNGAFKWGVSA
jgi:hypothetical protein